MFFSAICTETISKVKGRRFNMKKRSIFKKPQAAILALAMSISLLTACEGPAEKPEDDKTAEDLSMKDSDVPSSNTADDSCDVTTDSPGEAAGEADSFASPGEDVSGSMEWNIGNEVTLTQGNCDFHAFMSTDGKESWIYKVTSHKDGLTKLKFPAKVNDAPVTRIGIGFGVESELYDEEMDCYFTIFSSILEPWHGLYGSNDSITTIEFPETLTRIEGGAFCGFKKLKKVEIPDGVEELTPYSFANCPKLTEVKFPAGLTTLDFDAFDKSRAISKLTISSKSKNYKTKNGFLLSKDSKSLTWAAPAMTEVIIPEGVTKLGDNALFATKATKVVIPKSVCDIGSCALSGKNIKKIELKKGNKVFKMDGNCIYNKSDKSLTAILIKNGRAEISSKIEILGEGISVMGNYIERVDIPKSVNKVIENWMFFPRYAPDTAGGDYVKVYFHGTKPPQIVSEVPGYEFTCLPLWNEVYVPKKAKKAYIRWANDRDGSEWEQLNTF